MDGTAKLNCAYRAVPDGNDEDVDSLSLWE
jgi:hypothetical protein